MCAQPVCVQSQGETSSLTAVHLCRYAYELGAEPVLGAGVAKWFKRKGHRLSTNVSLIKPGKTTRASWQDHAQTTLSATHAVPVARVLEHALCKNAFNRIDHSRSGPVNFCILQAVSASTV